jgi:hypothetical protein
MKPTRTLVLARRFRDYSLLRRIDASESIGHDLTGPAANPAIAIQWWGVPTNSKTAKLGVAGAASPQSAAAEQNVLLEIKLISNMAFARLIRTSMRAAAPRFRASFSSKAAEV